MLARYLKKATPSTILALCVVVFFAPEIAVPLINLWAALDPMSPILSLSASSKAVPNSWQYWWELKNIATLLSRTLFIGLLSTGMSVMLATLLFSSILWRKRASKWVAVLTLVGLSFPHVSLAIGVKSVFTEVGWLSRSVCLFFPCNTPPIAILENWPLLTTVVIWVLKESLFLLYLFEAKAKAHPWKDWLCQSMSLGYSPYRTFFTIFYPPIYQQIRLPIFVVLSYSLTSVEIPLTILPIKQKTLSLYLLDLYYHPQNLDLVAPLISGSLLLVGLYAFAIMLWVLAEQIFKAAHHWSLTGGRRRSLIPAYFLNRTALWLISITWLAAILGLAVSSFTTYNPFPQFLPTTWTLRNYQSANESWWMLVQNSLLLAVGSTLFALLVAFFLLEAKKTTKKWFRQLSYLNLLFLVFPQFSFVFCFSILIELILPSQWAVSLVWVHSLYSFSYLYLILHEQEKQYDQRYSLTALSLQKPPWVVFFTVKLPIFLPAVLSATAIGMSVSLSLYLPTLFTAGGRFPTLLLETMSMANSFDIRLSATYGFILSLLPLLVFLLFAGVQMLYKTNLTRRG